MKQYGRKIVNIFFFLYGMVLKPAGDVLQRSSFGYIPHCMHSPTCSRYAREEIGRHGILRGSFHGLKRLLSCWGLFRRKKDVWR